jgi:hypothetical protein
VPAGNIALAGIDLDRLRAAPLYPKLPPAALSLAESYRSAQRLLAAWNGTDVLIVIRGTAPGAMTVVPNLAVSGSDTSIRAALAQYRSGKSGVPALVDAAKSVASSQIWAVAQGGIALPVEGNARNLNRLFRNLDYAAMSMDLDSSVDVRATGVGRTEQGTREFEQSLRAILSLASAAEARNPQIANLLSAVQIQRSGMKATASLRAGPEAVGELLEIFAK